jgi:uncharacterized protein
VEETALRIGREWKVGAQAGIGDRTRNAGVVVLVVPKETSSDGRGHCRIETGQGAEGFITDATAGAICRDAVPLFQRRDYAGAIERIATVLAQRYAAEFGTSIEGVPPPRAARRGGSGGGSLLGTLLVFFIVLMILSSIGGRRRRGCVGCLPVPVGVPPVVVSPGWHRSGWGGGGFGGGFGGGGFGGFGGGGGFSGGGGGSSW